MMRWLLLSLAACGASTAPAKEPASSRVAPSTDPAQVAAAAIRDGLPLDYELPFADRSERRAHRVQASVTACAAGHKPSCWTAMYMAPKARRAELATAVVANCRAGDVMSCRALPVSDEEKFPSLLGGAGRSQACAKHEAACKSDALPAECASGFPESCRALGMFDRYYALTAIGCDAWILAECSMVSNDAADELRRLEKQCELIGSCDGVGNRARDAGKLDKARDAYERSCQYDDGDRHRCLGLGEAYLDHEFPEPVPGRGQALLDWACMQSQKDLDKGDSIADVIPACKRMTHL